MYSAIIQWQQRRMISLALRLSVHSAWLEQGLRGYEGEGEISSEGKVRATEVVWESWEWKIEDKIKQSKSLDGGTIDHCSQWDRCLKEGD